MDRRAAKDLLYGGVLEMAQDERYFYKSVGSDYSRWTDLGMLALTEYLRVMACIMIHTEHAELDQRAKSMVINTLKGDTI
jgi:hypothetical protein